MDEVGDIPPALQPKLLRVLQEQQFERLGSGRTHQVDVRLVAATNRISPKWWLGDSFAAICTIVSMFFRSIARPPRAPARYSRSRRAFREDISRRMGKQVDSVPPETMAAFQWYSWPGNIRELQNLVERAVILPRDGVLPNPLPKSRTDSITPSAHRSQGFQRL